jgi:hypothetical protein
MCLSSVRKISPRDARLKLKTALLSSKVTKACGELHIVRCHIAGAIKVKYMNMYGWHDPIPVSLSLSSSDGNP